MSVSAAVVADGITKAFAKRTAVDGITLRVYPGQVQCLFGPDGSGKTTTLRLLSGALTPDRGRVALLGVDMSKDPAAARERIGYLGGGSHLYLDLSVEENLGFFVRVHGIPRREEQQRIAELLSFTDLGPFRRRLASQLSGGMRQRLALATALAHNPEVLLLDEPTTGLDPVVRRDLWSRFYTLAKQGTALLLTTPYLDEAERCQQVALLSAGRIVSSGTPSQLSTPFAGRVIEIPSTGRSRIEVRRAALTVDHVRYAYTLGNSVRVIAERQADEVLHPLEVIVRSLGWEERPTPATPRLEDAFIWMLGERG